MRVLDNTIAALALLASPACALPQETSTAWSTVVTSGVSASTSTSHLSQTTLAMVPVTTAPPSSSSTSHSSSSFTGHCDYRFCTSGKDVCFYWAGYTSWDVSRGPIPGETITILGTC
ncbi:hypothetical protein AAE478_003160 [Parahypoxylon ruwenzoriense]